MENQSMLEICHMRKLPRWGTVIFLVGLAACASGLKSTVVTEENQAEISEQVKTVLTYQEVQWLNSYAARTAPDLEEGQIPFGKSVGEMIEEQRTFEAGGPAGAGSQASTLAEEQIGSQVDDVMSSKREEQSAQVSNLGGDGGKRQQSLERRPLITQPVAPPPPPAAAVVPSGTVLVVRLDEYLSTKSNQAGETFETQLEEDLRVGRKLLAPAGSRVTGRLTNVKQSGKVEGRAQMGITLHKIFVGKQEYALTSNSLNYEAEATTREDAKKIGIGAGAGALIGALAGGKKGAAVGTAVGASIGTGAVLATSGEEVEFKIEHLFKFTLEREVEMQIVRN